VLRLLATQQRAAADGAPDRDVVRADLPRGHPAFESSSGRHPETTVKEAFLAAI
jgi:hypothetical protein